MSDLNKLTHGYQAKQLAEREAWMDRVIERYKRMEAQASSGDVSHHEFDEVGLTERIDLLRDEIDELKCRVNGMEQ